MRERGRSKTGIASQPHVKLAPMSAPGSTGQRQEHMDAVISFAGAGQRGRLFRLLDILTIQHIDPQTVLTSPFLCQVLGPVLVTVAWSIFELRASDLEHMKTKQRGKRAGALTASASISKAMKRFGGGATQNSTDCRKNWTTALIPRSSGSGTHPTNAECAEAARVAWGGGRYQAA